MSRKSRTVMFRSIDDPIVTIETKISIPVKLNIKFRYSGQSAYCLRESGIGALFGFVATVSEEVPE